MMAAKQVKVTLNKRRMATRFSNCHLPLIFIMELVKFVTMFGWRIKNSLCVSYYKPDL
jgi:hypothetical protein